MRYTLVLIELVIKFLLVHFLILAFSPITLGLIYICISRSWLLLFLHGLVCLIQIVPSLVHTRVCTRARDCFSVNYVAKCLFATFATKKLACCSMGTKDRNWLQIFI